VIFYLAAKYRWRLVVKQIATKIEAQSPHTVISRWLSGAHDGVSIEDQARWASEDFADIDCADCLVVFQLPVDEPEQSSGRHIEHGYALGKGKQIIIVGKSTSVFQYAQKTTSYPSLDAFYQAILPQS
jgi:nucleoside 2-deoxyribosyltransferase